MKGVPILVQKFGGTSVSTAERRGRAIEHVRRALSAGNQVAVVVSAMGRRGDPYATDTLLDLLRQDGPVDPRASPGVKYSLTPLGTISIFEGEIPKPRITSSAARRETAAIFDAVSRLRRMKVLNERIVFSRCLCGIVIDVRS